MRVGQPPIGMGVIIGVGVDGGVEMGMLTGLPVSKPGSFFNQPIIFGLVGSRIIR
jgi:hypothetical protein